MNMSAFPWEGYFVSSTWSLLD